MFANMTHAHLLCGRLDAGRLAKGCQAAAFEVRLLDVVVDVLEREPAQFADPANGERISEKFLQNSHNHVHKHSKSCS